MTDKKEPLWKRMLGVDEESARARLERQKALNKYAELAKQAEESRSEEEKILNPDEEKGDDKEARKKEKKEGKKSLKKEKGEKRRKEEPEEEEEAEDEVKIHPSMEDKEGLEAFKAYLDHNLRLDASIDMAGILFELLKDSPKKEESILYRFGFDLNDIKQAVLEIVNSMDNSKGQANRFKINELNSLYELLSEKFGHRKLIFYNIFGFNDDTQPAEIQARAKEFLLIMSDYPEIGNYDIEEISPAIDLRYEHQGITLDEIREGTEDTEKVLGFPQARHDTGIRFSKKYRGKTDANDQPEEPQNEAGEVITEPEVITKIDISNIRNETGEHIVNAIVFLDTLKIELNKDAKDSVFTKEPSSMTTDEEVMMAIEEEVDGLGMALLDASIPLDNGERKIIKDILSVIADAYKLDSEDALKYKIIEIASLLKRLFPQL